MSAAPKNVGSFTGLMNTWEAGPDSGRATSSRPSGRRRQRSSGAGPRWPSSQRCAQPNLEGADATAAGRVVLHTQSLSKRHHLIRQQLAQALFANVAHNMVEIAGTHRAVRFHHRARHPARCTARWKFANPVAAAA